MMFLTMALGFFRSKAGVYVLIGIAVLGGLWWLHHAGYVSGVEHERAAMTGKFQLAANDLATCKANASALETSIDRQNAAQTIIQQESDRKLAIAAKALSTASQGRASAEAKAARLLTHAPAGIDACARMEAADAAVLGTVK